MTLISNYASSAFVLPTCQRRECHRSDGNVRIVTPHLGSEKGARRAQSLSSVCDPRRGERDRAADIRAAASYAFFDNTSVPWNSGLIEVTASCPVAGRARFFS
jgi:hypothetical protein